MKAMRRPPSEWHGKRLLNDPRTIERRILDALIWIVHTRKWKPKAIYLTPADHALFVANRRTQRERNTVDGIPVRLTPGRTSVFYTTAWRSKRI